jgi:hypothetical protein
MLLVQGFTLIGTYQTAPLLLLRRCPSARYRGMAVVGVWPKVHETLGHVQS